MTERSVDKRLSEWKSKHGIILNKKAVYNVAKNHKFLERLIHLYLDYCRIHRYPTTTGCFF